jgi:hypothetical protein
MMLLIALAGQMMATLPQPARDTVPATGFACRFTTADGKAFGVAGVTPPFKPGRDPNADQPITISADGMAELAGRGGVHPITDASAMFRDFQLALLRGEATYIATIKVRASGDGIAWMTRYAPSTPPEPYRYFAVGHCRSDFEGKPVS